MDFLDQITIRRVQAPAAEVPIERSEPAIVTVQYVILDIVHLTRI